MAAFMEHAYSLVHQDNTADQPTLQELKTYLEKGTDVRGYDHSKSMKRNTTVAMEIMDGCRFPGHILASCSTQMSPVLTSVLLQEVKVETMKRILTIMLNGDPMPSLLMHIIRFVYVVPGNVLLLSTTCCVLSVYWGVGTYCLANLYVATHITLLDNGADCGCSSSMPSKSKPLKKLLYFYYEICPKLDSAGKLKQEMILVW